MSIERKPPPARTDYYLINYNVKKSWACLCLLVGIFSCHYDDNSLYKKMGTEYFPNKTGNYWVYSVIETMLNHTKTYTVTVNITTSVKLANNETAFQWLYHYPDRVDTLYYISSNDSVRIFYRLAVSDTTWTKYYEVFYLPFTNGQAWKSNTYGSYFVTQVGRMEIENAIYPSVFSILNEYGGPNIYYKDRSYFVPNVGYIKMDNSDYNLAPLTHQIWFLEEYSLN